MKLIFYLFVSFYSLSIFSIYANKVKEDSNKIDSVKWEEIDDNDIKGKSILWKSFNDDESYFEEKKDNNVINFFTNNQIEKFLTNIDSFIPTNNFLKPGKFQTKIEWKSTFDGGESRGIGQQNPSLLIDYGISTDFLLSLYFSEADDELYNLIDKQKIPYNWQTIAVSLKKRLYENTKNNISISMVSTIEYLRMVSGSETTKSIFNNQDESYSKEKFHGLVGAVSLPFTKKINNDIKILLIPGITFLPEKVGNKVIGKNSYGNNFYLSTAVIYDLSDNLKLLATYTNPFGPGHNYFNKNLVYRNNPLYSYGFIWQINQKLDFEGKITNSFGSTPSTGLLTIPSDNKNLYAANFVYKPFGSDTMLNKLDNTERLISFGGLTVNNALIQDIGKSQGALNFDSRGNMFFSYKYSLSNIFQIEFLDIGTFQDDISSNGNLRIKDNYVNDENLNFRLGGKLLIFSPQKNDLIWTSLRTSVGRNDDTNQGYMYSELINTLKIKKWMTINFTPKYFHSGIESFGAIGFSKYISLSKDFQIIPEINVPLKKDFEYNSTLSLRYLLTPTKSLDLYYSNALGLQDLGQILKGEDKLGLKLTFIY
tara:strand:- start:2477 stop:4258 length:1782 start_codon:yes stop_codon:yes gene_type:complete